jgi:hypothetical protein
MKFPSLIPLDVHVLFDYLGGAIFVALPYLFQFSEIAVARHAFLALGLTLIAYSLCTDYIYGLFKIIPLKIHIVLDVLSALVITASPFLFQYHRSLSGAQLAVHLVFGPSVIALVALTDYSKITKYSRRASRNT